MIQKSLKDLSLLQKNPKWYAAMCNKMLSLQQIGTRNLVPRPKNSNVVGSKWVFRTNFYANGSIDRFKANLVAQGFTQVPGLDYSATFCSIVQASTVHVVLFLVVLHKCPLYQLDVKYAFLNGNLSDIVFMELSPGFIDSQLSSSRLSPKESSLWAQSGTKGLVSTFKFFSNQSRFFLLSS